MSGPPSQPSSDPCPLRAAETTGWLMPNAKIALAALGIVLFYCCF